MEVDPFLLLWPIGSDLVRSLNFRPFLDLLSGLIFQPMKWTLYSKYFIWLHFESVSLFFLLDWMVLFLNTLFNPTTFGLIPQILNLWSYSLIFGPNSLSLVQISKLWSEFSKFLSQETKKFRLFCEHNLTDLSKQRKQT